MDLGLLAIATMVSLAVLLFLGLPVAFSLIAISTIFALAFLPSASLAGFAYNVYGVIFQDVLLAVPLFLLMASFLHHSGLAKDIYDVAYKWSGGMRGSLGIATIAAGTLIGAMTGIGTTGVATMGMVGFPQMDRYQYDRRISLGSIAVAGALGPIIPPSNLYIVLSIFMGGVSVGTLFIAGIIPGLVIAGTTAAMIIIWSVWNPKVAPALPREERATWREKFISVKGLVVPLAIIAVVIGGIYSGVWTVIEAAGAGAWATFAYGVAVRKIGIKEIKDSLMATFRLSAVVYWLVIAGSAFSSFISAAGIGFYLRDVLVSLPLGPTGIMVALIIIVLVMGMFIESMAIIFITVPIFQPLIGVLGVDPVWFAMVYSIALVTGYITPPFGYNLFYLKATIGERVSMAEIYAAGVPFMLPFVVTIVLLFVFPQLAVWLPRLMGV